MILNPKSQHTSQLAWQAGANPGFCSMNWLTVIPPALSSSYPIIQSWAEKDNTGVKCLAQEHNAPPMTALHINHKSVTNWCQPVFHESILAVIDHKFHHNIVKVAVDPQDHSQVHSQTTLTMWWQNSSSTTGQTNEKVTSICFLLSSKLSTFTQSLHEHCINYKFMYLRLSIMKISQWVCENFCSYFKKRVLKIVLLCPPKAWGLFVDPILKWLALFFITSKKFIHL